MYSQNEVERSIKMNPIVVGGIIFGIVTVIILIISFVNIFRTNSYGDEIRIDNLSEFYEDLPQEQQDLIFHQLYMVVSANLSGEKEIPNSGATIRGDSAKYDYDKEIKVYYGNFIVDIPMVEQSYGIQFEWSPQSNNQNLGGYPVVITCLAKSLQIYKNDACVGNVTETVDWENAYQLDYTFGVETSFKIRAVINNFLTSKFNGEDEYKVVVDETTLKRDKNQPDLTFSFDLRLNQNKIFEIIVRTDILYGDEYIVVYINGEDRSEGVVMTDLDDLKNDLKEWLMGISGKRDLIINIEDLEN